MYSINAILFVLDYASHRDSIPHPAAGNTCTRRLDAIKVNEICPRGPEISSKWKL